MSQPDAQTINLMRDLDKKMNALARLRRALDDISSLTGETERAIAQTSLGEKLAQLRRLKKSIRQAAADCRQDAIQAAIQVYYQSGRKKVTPDMTIQETSGVDITDSDGAIQWAIGKNLAGVINLDVPAFKKAVSALADVDFPDHCAVKTTGLRGAVKADLSARLPGQTDHRHVWMVEGIFGPRLLLTCPDCGLLGLVDPTSEAEWLDAIIKEEAYAYVGASAVEVI